MAIGLQTDWRRDHTQSGWTGEAIIFHQSEIELDIGNLNVGKLGLPTDHDLNA